MSDGKETQGKGGKVNKIKMIAILMLVILLIFAKYQTRIRILTGDLNDIQSLSLAAYSLETNDVEKTLEIHDEDQILELSKMIVSSIPFEPLASYLGMV